MSRRVGGEYFQMRVWMPRISTLSISKGEPGRVMRACAWASESAGQERCVSDTDRSPLGSVSAESGQAVGVEVRIPKELLPDAGALHEQADIEFVGHSDTTVHLYALLHGQRRRRARDDRSGGIESSVQHLQRLQHRRARDFQLAVEMSRTVLKGLKLADQTTELLTLTQIRDGAHEHFLTQAEQLR